KFDITTDEDFMEVFDDMCNLSDGVYLDGVEKGIIQGKAEGLLQGEARGIEKGIIQGKAEGIMQGAENKQIEMLRQFMKNGRTFEEFIKLFNITDKNEITFLKENIQVQ
ncbi:MAG: hypothetical protein Q4A45_05490, partial [Clostridia bacterium]|nr:hypothetical protein [Clostridia bacterium]